MTKSVRQTASECVLDLGITVVYAAVVGLAIALIAASDAGAASFPRSLAYASLLPAFVAALVAADFGIRLLSEHRDLRRRQGFASEQS